MADLEQLRAEVANYNEDLRNVLSDMLEAAERPRNAFEVTLPYRFHSRYYSRHHGMDTPFDTVSGGGTCHRPEHYEYDVLLADLRELSGALRDGFDHELDEAAFDDVASMVKEIIDILAAAKEEGLEGVRGDLQGWTGGAADQFENTIIRKFERALSDQAMLAREIGIAALAYQAIVVMVKADVLGLSDQLRDRVAPGDSPFSFGDVLFVISAVAAGIGAVAGGPIGVIGWLASTSLAVKDKLFQGLEKSGAGSGTGERTISGALAEDFIGSTRTQSLLIKIGTFTQEAIVAGALAGDLADVAASDLRLPNPALAGIDKVDDLGRHPDSATGFSIDDIANLKKSGDYLLPMTAMRLHDAHLKLAEVRGRFRAGVGSGELVGGRLHVVEGVIDALDTAFTELRDQLYESGVALSAAADDYFTTDAQRAELFRVFTSAVDGLDGDRYRPITRW